MNFFNSVKSKRGATLAIVVMAGLAIVVLSVGLLPLVTASQKDVNGNLARRLDYIESRSSLEFAKSALYDSVVNKNSLPSDFYVLRSEAGDYRITKNETEFISVQTSGKLSIGTDEYTASAFCDVDTDNIERTNGGTVYKIKTETLGSKKYTFNTSCTIPNSSLTIIPAAYLNRTAMPLSNFIVTDGGYADKKLWNYSSTLVVNKEKSYVNGEEQITYITEFGNINESFLRKTDEQLAVSDYAVVLKSEVTPYKLTDSEYAGYLTTGGNPESEKPVPFSSYEPSYQSEVALRELTDEIIESSINSGSLVYSVGSISFDEAVFGEVGGNTVLRYNGSTEIPTAPGKYTLTLDFDGSSIFAPRSGINLGEKSISKEIPLLSSYYHIDKSSVRADSCAVIKDSECPYSLIVNYGWSYEREPENPDTDIRWQAESDFSALPPDKEIFIWVCNESNGEYSSARTLIGSVLTETPAEGVLWSAADTVENGCSYIIYINKNGRYYALSSSGEGVLAADITDIITDSAFEAGVINGDITNIEWTAEYAAEPDKGFNLKNSEGRYVYAVQQSKYSGSCVLRMNSAGFPVNSEHMWEYSGGKLFRTVTIRSFFSRTVNSCLYINNNNNFALQADSSQNIYLMKIDKAQPLNEPQHNRIFPENGTPVISRGLITTIGSAAAIIDSPELAEIGDEKDYYSISDIKVNGVAVTASAQLPDTPGCFAVYALLTKSFTVDSQVHTVSYPDTYIGMFRIAKKTVSIDFILGIENSGNKFGKISNTQQLYAAAQEAAKSPADILEALTGISLSYTITSPEGSAQHGAVICGISRGDEYSWYGAESSVIKGLSLGTEYSARAIVYGTWEYDVAASAQPADRNAPYTVDSLYGDYCFSSSRNTTTPERLMLTPEDFDFDSEYTGEAYTDVSLTTAPIGFTQNSAALEYCTQAADGIWLTSFVLEESPLPYYVRLKVQADNSSNRFYCCSAEGIILGKQYTVGAPAADKEIYSANSEAYAASYIAAPAVYLAASGRSSAVEATAVSTTDCVNTMGTNMLIYANLLVFNSGINDSSGGKIILRSYNKSFTERLPAAVGGAYAKDILVYFYQTVVISNGTKFNGACFYSFPNETDLCGITQAQADSAYAGKTLTQLGEDNNCIITWVNEDRLKPFFDNGTMPEIELDIAFATQAQLENIISGETATWSLGGKLKPCTIIEDNSQLENCDNISLNEFVVCIYSDGCLENAAQCRQEYSANRIMLECGNSFSSGSNQTKAQTELKTRYLSISAPLFMQGNPESSFTVKSLALSATEKQLAAEMLSLEVDFERDTNISCAASYSVSRGIYAYASGTDLFGASVTPSENINFTTYSTDYVNGYCAATEGKAGQGVIFCDKYIRITNDASAYNGTKFTDCLAMKPLTWDGINSPRSLRVYFYTSLLYLDIDEIRCESYQNDYHVYFYIAPQEAAYSNQKYLDLFFKSQRPGTGNAEVYYSGPVLIYINSSDAENGLKYWDAWGKVTPNYPYYNYRGTSQQNPYFVEPDIVGGVSVNRYYSGEAGYKTSEKLKTANVCASYVSRGTQAMQHDRFTVSDNRIINKQTANYNNEAYVYIPNGLYLVDMNEVYSQEVAQNNSLNEVRCFSLALLAAHPEYYRVTDEALLASYGIRLDDNNDILSTVFLDYDLTNNFNSSVASLGNGTVN